MNLVKKLSFIGLGLVALIATGFYLFLKVRESQSKEGLVHRQSEYVIKVAVDHILMNIAWNALQNPGYYSKKDTTRRASSSYWERTELGVQVPASVYLFSLDDDQATWYTLLQIDDKQKLQRFIMRYSDGDSSQIERHADTWWVSHKNNRISFLGDSKKVLIAFSLNKNPKREKMATIWARRDKHMVAIGTLGDFNFAGTDADIQWQKRNAEYAGNVSFASGHILSEVLFSNQLLKLPEQAKVRQLPESNVLNIHCQADIRAILEKYRKDLQRYNIPVDTLTQFYGGYMDVQWRKKDVLQTDSIITYDYDEDFNSIEKKELREEAVPNLVFTFKASPHLGDYLPQKMFYKFYKTITDDQIGLSTDLQLKNAYSYTISDTPIFVSYQRDTTVIRHLSWLPRIQDIKGIQIKGKAQGKMKNIIHAKIQLEKDDIHALYQILN